MRAINMSATLLAAASLAAGIAMTSLAGSSALAQSSSSYAYCLFAGPAQECAYHTMAQCMAARRGGSDFCQQNNLYAGDTYARSYRARPPQ